MEHIIDSSGIKYLSITVPYLCEDTFEYAAEMEFSDYGEVLGYNKAKTLYIETQENAHDFAQLLQKWLFFGFLTECFGAANMKITTTTFRGTTEDGRKVICTAGLNDLLQRWARTIPTLSLELRTAAALKIQDLISVAQVQIKGLGKILAAPVSEVHLSISVVSAAIVFAIRHVFRRNGTCPVLEWTGTKNYQAWGKSRLIVDNLMSKGWCSYEVAQLYGGSFSTVGMVFAASLSRPLRRETHENCTEKVCRAFDIDESTYIQRHAPDDCTCENLQMDHEDLCAILKSGGIVVLQLEWDGYEELKVKALRSTGLRYIAISHVWSDGLGNPLENSIPTCRFKQLDKMVRDMLSISKSEPIYVWLDTLCVTAEEIAKDCPRDVDGLNCRQLAILRMRDTYRDADEVLVLDWQLQNSIAKSKVEENLLRILVSGWMRRLWTFQEAWLSKKLIVQFKNKAIRLDRQLWELDMQDYLPLWAEVGEAFLSTKKSIFSDVSESSKIAMLWNALQGRTTSHQSDEAFVIGTMLDMDITEILKQDKDQRMFKLLSSIDIYPSQIIFMPGPRMQEPGYGWAPSSFFGRQRWTPASGLEDNFLPVAEVHTMSIRATPALRSDSGLLMRARGLLLQPVIGQLCHAFYISHEERKFIGVAHYLEQEDTQEWYDRKIEEFKDIAVVIDHEASSGDSVLAALVCNCQLMRTIMFAKFVCRLWFGSSRPSDRLPSQDYAVDKISGKKFTMLTRAEVTQNDQMWCIG